MWSKAIVTLDEHKYSLDEYGRTWENVIRENCKTYPGGMGKSGQQEDCNIIATLTMGNKNWWYESEKRMYIPDYAQLRKPYTKSGNPHQVEVYFDHVLYYRDFALPIESDDISHYDKSFYKNLYKRKGITITDEQAEQLLQENKKKDAVKDIWARTRNFPFLRIPYYLTKEQKTAYLREKLTYFKQQVDNYYATKTITNSN